MDVFSLGNRTFCCVSVTFDYYFASSCFTVTNLFTVAKGFCYSLDSILGGGISFLGIMLLVEVVDVIVSLFFDEINPMFLSATTVAVV
jgi:hypothetical protein